MGELYTYIIRGAFGVARFDNPGNAKALTRGTSDRTGSTFFLYVLASRFRQQRSRLANLLTEADEYITKQPVSHSRGLFKLSDKGKIG